MKPTGLYFDDFQDFHTGKVIVHGDQRIKIAWVRHALANLLTSSWQPQYWKRNPIVNDLYVLGRVISATSEKFTHGTLVGTLSYEDITNITLVRIGDTLEIVTTFVRASDIKTYPNSGKVELMYEVINQHSEMVLTLTQLLLIRRRSLNLKALK